MVPAGQLGEMTGLLVEMMKPDDIGRAVNCDVMGLFWYVDSCHPERDAVLVSGMSENHCYQQTNLQHVDGFIY